MIAIAGNISIFRICAFLICFSNLFYRSQNVRTPYSHDVLRAHKILAFLPFRDYPVEIDERSLRWNINGNKAKKRKPNGDI